MAINQVMFRHFLEVDKMATVDLKFLHITADQASQAIPSISPKFQGPCHPSATRPAACPTQQALQTRTEVNTTPSSTRDILLGVTILLVDTSTEGINRTSSMRHGSRPLCILQAIKGMHFHLWQGSIRLMGRLCSSRCRLKHQL